MFEYRWETPGKPTHEIVLHVHSTRGWFGRKTVTVDERLIARRGRFQGVFCRFAHPDTGERLEIRLVRVADSPIWRPALFQGGREIAQAGGTPPPKLVPPPKSIAVSAALVYVAMLMALVSYLPITKILSALYLNHDDCRVALTVRAADADETALRVLPSDFGATRAGEEFSGALKAAGGVPPYAWAREEGGWPRGITLDEATGRLHGTPAEPRDFSGKFTVTDAAGQTASGAFAVAVTSVEAVSSERPRIKRRALPPATVGQSYEFTFAVEGGRPAPGADTIEYGWKTLGRQGLPDGLELDRATGRISGVPTKTFARPLIVQVYDRSYAAVHDIAPWMIPMLVSGVCLTGYLTMRRSSVYVFGALVSAQAVVWALVLAPISATALTIQAVVWAIGALHVGKMH